MIIRRAALPSTVVLPSDIPVAVAGVDALQRSRVTPLGGENDALGIQEDHILT